MKKSNVIHVSFDIALLLKGLNAIVEIVGGIILYFFSPEKLKEIIKLITGEELAENPNSFFMNHLAAYGQNFSISSLKFGMFYLISHGIIKIIIVLLLWREKLWAYPFSIFAFTAFVIYQTNRYFSSHSILLLVLNALDIIVIILTILEYKRIKPNTKSPLF